MLNRFIVATACVAVLAGCAAAEPMRPPLPRALPVLEDTSVAVAPDPARAIGGGAQPAPIPATRIERLVRAEGTPLPEVRVPSLSLVDTNLNEALKLVLLGTNIGYTVVNGAGGAGVRININNLSGTLAEVLDELAEAGEFFYAYHDGRLRVTPSRHFTVQIPAAPEFMKTVARSLTNLGATSVDVDMATATVSFHATRPAASRIDEFLRQARGNLVQITFDVSIIEVRLRDSNSYGVQWDRFDAAGAGRGASLKSLLSGTAGALTAAVELKLGRRALSAVFDFLQTQGDARLISQPKMTAMTGGKATFNVGNSRKMVTRVSQSTATNAATSTSAAETEEVNTGINIELESRYSQGTIFTQAKVSLTEFVGQQTVTVLGQELTLPEVSRREFTNPLRVAEGETIILAGILQNKDTVARSGAKTGIGLLDAILPGKTENSAERTELVLILRPTVARYREAVEDAK